MPPGEARAHVWNIPPEDPVLARGEVHIWKTGLSLSASQREVSLDLLQPDERARAQRFRFQKDRQSYIAARTSLRQILARYLGRPAGEIRITYTSDGKPELEVGQSQGALHFNLAHSGDLALVALAAAPVGVDLEKVRPDFDYEGIVSGYFSPGEQAALEGLAGPERRRAFYRLWTRKESYQKARGVGLGIPAEQVPVIGSRGVGEEGGLGLAGEELLPGWLSFDLDPEDGYLAAVAVAGRGWVLQCFQFDG